MVVVYIPLVVVLAMLFVVALASFVDDVDHSLSRISIKLFGDFAADRRSANPDQLKALKGAHIPQTYRLYAARTYLFATIAALAASLLGVYLVAGILYFLGNAPDSLQQQFPGAVRGLFVESVGALGVQQLLLIFLVSGATLGVVGAFASYKVRWLLPSYEAGERARAIDTSMERTVAFMYALSRSGMTLPDILRILADNQEVYGEAAREMTIVVKDVDMYGADILRALQRLGDRTPSEDLEEFTENLGSVLQSGRSLSNFLKQQYEYYSEEAEANQRQFLELLATLAEAYVTVLVAGPLFLITILVIIGLTMGGTLQFLRLTSILLIPMATIAFVVYLDSITDTATGGTKDDETTGLEEGLRFQSIPDHTPAQADGGVVGDTRALNRERYQIHERLRPILYRLRHPFEVVMQHPPALFWVTTPIAFAYLGFQWYPQLTAGVSATTAYDDALVHATLFLLGTFAVAYEFSNRRVSSVEAGVPDFLDRFASSNEAGMSAVEAFGRTVEGKLGALTLELERTWADVQWGSRLENAFERFRQRVETPAISRVVTLTTNAMSASGDLGPVLRIAADEAKATRRLKRDRRNELLTYLVVIYVSFFVFIAIVVALDVIFIPNIPTGGLSAAGGEGAQAIDTGPFSGAGQLTEEKKAQYSTVFFHTGLVQAVCSGLVAGQMGEGTVKAGAKHATAMLAVAYLLFLFVG
jgi:flagellar protein FlaJ